MQIPQCDDADCRDRLSEAPRRAGSLAQDIVAILIELQMQSDGIVWATPKAVIFGVVPPWVYNLLHHFTLILFFLLSLF